MSLYVNDIREGFERKELIGLESFDETKLIYKTERFIREVAYSLTNRVDTYEHDQNAIRIIGKNRAALWDRPIQKNKQAVRIRVDFSNIPRVKTKHEYFEYSIIKNIEVTYLDVYEFVMKNKRIFNEAKRIEENSIGKDYILTGNIDDMSDKFIFYFVHPKRSITNK